jgi:antitoxin ParD1/3/4
VLVVPTRNVVLTDHQQQLIESLVSSGRYQNASEVLRDGLRLVELREQRDAVKLAALRSAVAEGFAAYGRGDFVEVDEADLDEYIRAVGQDAARRTSA